MRSAIGNFLWDHRPLTNFWTSMYIQSIDFNGIIPNGKLNGKIPLTVGHCGNPQVPGGRC